MTCKPKKCCAIGSYECQTPMAINARRVDVDYCIADIVAALNAANIRTLASCCGHGDTKAVIAIDDGRELFIEGAVRPWEKRIKQMTELTKAAKDVLAERQRQIDVEGYAPVHDDTHTNCEIGFAAMCYANPKFGKGNMSYTNHFPLAWPWSDNWWKPRTYRENLIRAGALIIAEIERLDRREKDNEL